MRVVFYVYKVLNDGKERETEIVEAFRTGAEKHGDSVEFIPAKNFVGAMRGYDVACAVGLRQHGRRVLKCYRRIGARVLLFDKGLIRTGNVSLYNRVCLDTGVPSKYLMRVDRPPDRWRELDIDVKPMREWTKDAPIIYANNSQKVHDFWGMGGGGAYTHAIDR